MSDIKPLTPADGDLRDFPFTPIFRARLFSSRFHARATDAEWRAGVTLWLKSWDQVPAGSLPDDDVDLCRLAELGRDLKLWRKIRMGALHGWTRAADGLLYHAVVAEGINEALARKNKHSSRGAKGAAARWNKHPDDMAQASFPDASSIPDEYDKDAKGNEQAMLVDGNRQGQGYERGDRERVSLRSTPSGADSEFEAFWRVYPRKSEGPGACRKEWVKARKSADFEAIMGGLERYPFKADFLPMPATWLNQKRWMTQPDTLPLTVATRRGGSVVDAIVDGYLDLSTSIDEQFPLEERERDQAERLAERGAVAIETGTAVVRR